MIPITKLQNRSVYIPATSESKGETADLTFLEPIIDSRSNAYVFQPLIAGSGLIKGDHFRKQRNCVLEIQNFFDEKEIIMRPQNAYLSVILAFSLTGLSGCGSSELSRSRAISLILDDVAFKPDAIVLDFRVGTGILDIGPVERDLEKAGLTTIAPQKCRPYNIRYAHDSSAVCGELSLTEKGVEISQKWKGTPWDNGKGMDYEIPVASRVVKEITGIREEPTIGTVAEFSWGCQPNDLAKDYHLDITPPVFMASGPRCPEDSDGSKKSEALFKRYDDGWHLEQIDW